MSALTPIKIRAEVDVVERPAVLFGAQKVAKALRAVTGVDWPIELTICEMGGLSAAAGDIAVLSLLSELGREEPFEETVARWRSRTERLVADGVIVMLLTVFRAVSERRTPQGQRLIERIRRLDRMALDLSHDVGVTVVDIDRALAHVGGRVLGTDYRISSRLAADVAGHSFALSLLSLGLDDNIPPATQERARTHLGPLREIDSVVRRRIAKARQAA
ncbi:MAG TPA: hypothetical protein VKT30_04550 [Caulobacteraceae bacterium]|nr:hypothetical protein [Caulobacteraceae bacterium]